MATRRSILKQLFALACSPLLPSPDAVKLVEPSPPQAMIPLWGEVMCVSLNGYGAMKIAEELEARDALWRAALDVPQGFEIPKRPIPTTQAEREAELDFLTTKNDEATRIATGPGQDDEAKAEAVTAMLEWRDARWRLMVAMRDDPVT